MIEDLIKKLIGALEENTAALKAAGGKATTTTTTKASDDAIAAEAAKAAAKGAGAKPKTKEPAAPTLDTIKAEFGGYLGIADKAVRKERMAEVQQIVDYFGVEKASLIDEDGWAQALEWLNAFKNGETPEIGEPDSGDAGGSLV